MRDDFIWEYEKKALESPFINQADFESAGILESKKSQDLISIDGIYYTRRQYQQPKQPPSASKC